MIEALRALAGVALPWVLGYAWVRTLREFGATNPYVEWGYGHFLGILLLTLVMRLVGWVGAPLSLGVLAPLVVVLVGAGTTFAYVRERRHRPVPAAALPIPDADPLAIRGLALIVAVLLVLRTGTLAVDVLLRPLFPWDAWTQWATKARVWSGLHALVPFIPWDVWLTRAPGYTDPAPHYPATIPLLQTWMTLALGRWDDALMNLPWLAGYVALALAIFGQLRRMSISVAWSLFTVYAVLSLPLLDAHVALAGYADFHVAAAFALAMLALIAWEKDRARVQLLLFGFAVVLLPLLKIPGRAWAVIAVVGLLVAAFGKSWKRLLAVGTGASAAVAMIAVVFWRERIEAVAGAPQTEISRPLVDNLFLFDNWHLLWFVLPIIVAVGWRDAIGAMRGASVALACGVLFLFAVFVGTRVGDWVTDYTTVNRALLHLAPAATVFGAVLIWSWALRRNANARPDATINKLAGRAAGTASSE